MQSSPSRSVAVVLALLLPACALRRAEPSEMAVMYDEEVYLDEGRTGGGYAEAAPPPAARSAAPSASKSVAYAPSSVAPPGPPPPPGQGSAAEDAASPAEARMVRYDGFLRLRVNALDAASDQLVTMAKEVGGRVESLSRTRLVLRVPVATFRERFDAMLKVGEALEKNISAQDVTDAFASVELRLKTARAAQERLQALLAKSTDEREKLMLLRELQRIGEEIDAMEAQSRTLVDLASMSRITVELVPRGTLAAVSNVQETSAFAWIRRLSPFRDEVLQGARFLALPVPTGMVSLDVKKRFLAESADGARIRAGRLDNEPEGSAGFWLDALQSRLAPEFAKAEVADVGDWKTLRLVDRSEEPYVYVLAVRVRGDALELVEVYYPSLGHEERYGAAVRAALVGGDA
jgi:hypothetical protein